MLHWDIRSFSWLYRLLSVLAWFIPVIVRRLYMLTMRCWYFCSGLWFKCLLSMRCWKVEYGWFLFMYDLPDWLRHVDWLSFCMHYL